MQDSKLKRIFINTLPLIVVALLFGLAQLLTSLGCQGLEGNCGYDLLWLLLWPFFFAAFIIALIATIALGLRKQK